MIHQTRTNNRSVIDDTRCIQTDMEIFQRYFSNCILVWSLVFVFSYWIGVSFLYETSWLNHVRSIETNRYSLKNKLECNHVEKNHNIGYQWVTAKHMIRSSFLSTMPKSSIAIDEPSPNRNLMCTKIESGNIFVFSRFFLRHINEIINDFETSSQLSIFFFIDQSEQDRLSIIMHIYHQS
jgi:hypothetical protein